jgi:hypothetical protein
VDARKHCSEAERIMMSEEQKAQALAGTARLLGVEGEESGQVLGRLWDRAFEEGRLAALDEFQDRFCVCMK